MSLLQLAFSTRLNRVGAQVGESLIGPTGVQAATQQQAASIECNPPTAALLGCFPQGVELLKYKTRYRIIPAVRCCKRCVKVPPAS